MILATRAHPQEIAAAVRAGANASLRDTEGQTALDYLNASNCRRNLLTNELTEFLMITGGECNALDKDDFRKSARILRKTATTKR